MRPRSIPLVKAPVPTSNVCYVVIMLPSCLEFLSACKLGHMWHSCYYDSIQKKSDNETLLFMEAQFNYSNNPLHMPTIVYQPKA